MLTLRRHGRNYLIRQLNVWQEAMSLVEEIYRVSMRFPSDERFGLTAQLRRATVSVPSNILLHLDIALGSQGEVDVQLEIARRLGLCEAADYERLRERVDRIGRMLNGLIEALQQREELPAVNADD